MTTNQSPQQAAMARLEGLITKTTQLHATARHILDIALHDSVNFPKYDSPGTDSLLERPVILTDDGIVELTRLKNELAELVNYYANQKEQFTASLNAFAERSASAQEEVVQQAPQAETVESLRERAERLAMEKSVAPSLTENLSDSPTPVIEPDNLPAAIPVVETQPEEAPALRPQENSIQRLLGANSPLLDIFAMSPWLPNGQGYITVGTPGFKWYKGTNPMEKDEASRATLPTGFYYGQDIPEFVVLRMTKCILVWSFKLDPDSMSVYMVGPSDADPNNIRWFKPSELASSHARQLLTEIQDAVEKYKRGLI